jgi:segregation and condensation protein A
MSVQETTQGTMHAEAFRAVVRGEALQQLPHDLYIPPDALEVILESFEGPLDLLLYLIRKQNLDILDIPVAEITHQYMQYIELMRVARLDLAAEYLLMAAMLAEIKSRMLLPRPEEEEYEEDPRAALVRRLQEYERFREAAFELDQLARLERDLFVASARFVDEAQLETQPAVSLEQLAAAFQNVLREVDRYRHLNISRELLSVRERMTQILDKLKRAEYMDFQQLFDSVEGRMGLIVTFIAILELCKDHMVVVVQSEPFAPIHVKSAA